MNGLFALFSPAFPPRSETRRETKKNLNGDRTKKNSSWETEVRRLKSPNKGMRKRRMGYNRSRVNKQPFFWWGWGGCNDSSKFGIWPENLCFLFFPLLSPAALLLCNHRPKIITFFCPCHVTVGSQNPIFMLPELREMEVATAVFCLSLRLG